jgi:hypothetical protein
MATLKFPINISMMFGVSVSDNNILDIQLINY